MKGKHIFLGICLFLDIGFLYRFSSYNMANKVVCIFCYAITVVLIISIYKDIKKKKLNEIEVNIKNEELIQNIRNGIIPRIEHCTLILKSNEFACNEDNIYLLETKNKTVGNTGTGGGVSVKVAKGVYIRSGSSTSKRTYKDVTEQYYGTFVITNQRVVFLNDKKGFEIPYSKLTGIFSDNKNLILQAQNKSYKLFTNTPMIYEELIRNIIKFK